MSWDAPAGDPLPQRSRKQPVSRFLNICLSLAAAPTEPADASGTISATAGRKRMNPHRDGGGSLSSVSA